MTKENLPNRSEVSFDFNLPHSINTEDNAGAAQGGSNQSVADMNDAQIGDATQQNLDYRQFSLGLSDDEGSGEAFERSWPGRKKHAAKAAKGKKSPRRSDNESEDVETNTRAKKPRQSLFGGADEEMDIDEQSDNILAPATPGLGLGNRMSSLTLDQQQDGDEAERSMNNGFGLACSDIGSVRNSSAPSDDEFIIPPDTVPYYKLRQNIDRQKAVTHVDTDKSGNFDPEQEAKERAAKLVRAKVAKKEKKEKRKKKSKNDTPRGYVMKYIVKLPFDAFGNVRNITSDEQNWPDNWSEIDSEQERELEEYRETFRANTPDRSLQLPLGDPAGEFDDLTGHPEARGCKQCRQLEQSCSMVKDGKYPCGRCVEDGGECRPIQEPAVKGRCNQCDQADEQVCSFENDPTQPICDHCADNDHICTALPPDGYKAPRVNIEEIDWSEGRHHVTCSACRKDKKQCSLKGLKDKPPCKYCTKNNIGCTFFDLPKLDSEKQAKKKKILTDIIAPEVTKPNSEYFTAEDLADMTRRNTVVLEREPTPEIEMEDGEGNKGMLTKITTSFAHPIRFQAQDCNFCEIPVFGVVGYFEREVHVIRWHNGLGYAEVGGGHCQDTGETSMCPDCTNRRLQIVVCPGHRFEQLVDAIIDHDALADELAEAETGGADVKYQLQRWCSVCFSPAFHGCCTVQPDVTGQEEVEVTGCHLRLCVACEQSLREDYGSNFDQMVKDMDIKPKIVEADELLGRETKGRPRADVGFLKQDGLLMLTVMAMSD
ncbi:hypothetical protein E8E12_010678 [Didymella heteroderae]|uniref:Zn(2)-C6 fungal-type domain-containing protein n=1 Tax=Didymella heteroderae TaxID=1769908 RepID=A0A9P4X1P4_9PLEO|nr:hypothetical protein E8E12_010678 [Didymella heteroderae]